MKILVVFAGAPLSLVLQITDQLPQSDPRRISRLPAWFAGPTTPSFSIRSISDAARL